VLAEDEGTATALKNPPKNGGTTYLVWQGRHPGHLNLSSDPLFSYSCPASPRLCLPRRSRPYGMQTVRPYLGAVKRVSLHIVSQS